MAKKKVLPVVSSAAEYLTYIASTGDSPESFEMRYEDENIWLTQKMMASLYDIDTRTISDHIQKIYEDGELSKEATIRNFRIVQMEGNRQVQRNIMHYNLQLIIAVCRASGSATYSYEHGGLVEEIRRISRVQW